MTKELWPGWETVEAIGTGGFSKVYKIRKKDSGDGREYSSALKIITIPQSPDEFDTYLDEGYDETTISGIFEGQVQRIVEEFHLMSQFRGNSNIVSYEDHRIVPHENGRGWDIYIRMELLTPLTKFSGQNPMTEEETIKLGIGICRALELCQKQNIIHRDIKPQNIFVNKFGDYKLGDFGIAKSMDHTTHATKTGTYSYMAPEVYRGEAYGATIDLYSLGLVLYWLLNERRMPFLPLPPAAPTAAQLNEAQARRLSGEAIPAPKNGSDDLKAIVQKACAFRAADRYATPAAMRRDLEKALFAIEVAKTTVGAATFAAAMENTVLSDGDDEKTVGVTAAVEHTVGIFGDAEEPIRPTTPEKAVEAPDPVPMEPVTAAPQEAPTKSGAKKWLAALCGVLLLLVIVILLLLLRECGNGKASISETTTDGAGDAEVPIITTTSPVQTTAPTTTPSTTIEAPPQTAPTTSAHGDWSEWSTELPEELLDRLIESSTQYRYRTAKVVESNEASYPGGILVNQTLIGTQYGSWSSWSATAVSATDRLDVETKRQYRSREIITTIEWGEWSDWSEWSTQKPTAGEGEQIETSERTKYVYSLMQYRCETCQTAFTAINSLFYVHIKQHGAEQATQTLVRDYIMGSSAYTVEELISLVDADENLELSYRYTTASTLEELEFGEPADDTDSALYPVEYMGEIWGSQTGTTNSVMTEYSYRIRYLNEVCSYTAWSAYSDTKITADSNTQVEERTVYRSRPITEKYLYQYKVWEQWSDWSFEKPEASENTESEQRTVYRYADLVN
ncbi:MAG: serine/threonine protein kinase [Clostridia bacterium]|nr:serine/threonine protein kinase [Clostridia bacterium]